MKKIICNSELEYKNLILGYNMAKLNILDLNQFRKKYN